MTPEEIAAANKVADAAREKAFQGDPDMVKTMSREWTRAEDDIYEFVRASRWASNEETRTILKRARLEYLKAYIAGKTPEECATAAKEKAGMI